MAKVNIFDYKIYSFKARDWNEAKRIIGMLEWKGRRVLGVRFNKHSVIVLYS